MSIWLWKFCYKCGKPISTSSYLRLCHACYGGEPILIIEPAKPKRKKKT